MSLTTDMIVAFVRKSGGLDKIRDLADTWRKVPASRSAEVVRAAAKSKAGAEQLYALALLGLAIAEHIAERDAQRPANDASTIVVDEPKTAVVVSDDVSILAKSRDNGGMITLSPRDYTAARQALERATLINRAELVTWLRHFNESDWKRTDLLHHMPAPLRALLDGKTEEEK